MSDDLYAELQNALVMRPDAGDLIPGCSGLRKIRWNLPGSGKRGGVRIIYYWMTEDDQIFMIFAYKKAKVENLTRDQMKVLRQLVEEELENG